MYEPNNARSNMRLLRRILVQPRSTLEQLRASIDKWEADLVEYVQRGGRDLDDDQKVTILLSMVPEQLEDHLEMNIGRLDTYAKARAEVISYREQKAAKVDEPYTVPMELDAFKGKKGAKGGGKTASKAKAGGGNPDKDVVCHLCKKKGHRKSACWYAKENGGTGKPPPPKEPKGGKPSGGKPPKGKGKGGKGGKTGKGKAHAFEGEGAEDQEWPGEEWPEEEQGDGELGFLCVLGPSVASTLEPRRAAKGQICRPAFGPVSWAGSQPWEVALAQCAVGKEDSGELLFWWPCPGCKGQKRRYSSDGLSQHLWTKVGQEGHPGESQFSAWDQEAKKGFYVRPELPESRGSLAHCGSEPTWIYLPEEPDYSKHHPEPEDFGEEAGDSEAESDDATVEVQEEEEQEEAAPAESKEAEAAREKEEQEKLMQQRASELLQQPLGAERASGLLQRKRPGQRPRRRRRKSRAAPRARPGENGNLPRRHPCSLRATCTSTVTARCQLRQGSPKTLRQYQRKAHCHRARQRSPETLRHQRKAHVRSLGSKGRFICHLTDASCLQRPVQSQRMLPVRVR